MKFQFMKYHGCGNDFIIINNLNNQYKFSSEIIEKLCNRHFGIGADGLILVEKRDNNFFMNYYNSDGSKAEMCGNGLRCTADFIFSEIDNSTNFFNINCRDGLHSIIISPDNIEVTVKKPNFDIKNFNQNLKDQLIENPHILSFGLVNVGNPHLVLEVDKIENIPEDLCHNLSLNYLSEGVNVNLVQKVNKNSINLKTYERGDGFTLACGTGACASVSFLNKINHCLNKVLVNLPGGQLWVNLKDNEVILSGNTKRVFQGELNLLDFK